MHMRYCMHTKYAYSCIIHEGRVSDTRLSQYGMHNIKNTLHGMQTTVVGIPGMNNRVLANILGFPGETQRYDHIVYQQLAPCMPFAGTNHLQLSIRLPAPSSSATKASLSPSYTRTPRSHVPATRPRSSMSA